MKMSKSFLYMQMFILFIFSAGWSQPLALDVNKCVEIALKNNDDLRIQQQQTIYAEEQVKQIKSTRLPQFGVSANYSWISDVMESDLSSHLSALPFQVPPITLRFGDYHNYAVDFTLTQPLYTGGQLSNSIKAVGKSLQAQKSSKKTVQNNLVYQIKQTYFSLVNAKQKRQLAELSIELINAHLKDVNNMHEQGLVPQNEVLKVEIKKAEMELVLNQADNGIELLKSSLLNLMGMDLGTEINIDEDLDFSPSSPSESDAVVQANKFRPELQTIEHNLGALSFMKKSAKGAYRPTIALVGNYEYGKPGLDKLANEWMDYWMVGVSAKWNLWDWGKKKSKVAQAEATLQKTVATQAKVRKGIRLEIQQALLKKQEAQDRVLVFRKIKAQAEENFRLVQDRFQNGLETNTEFLNAQTQLTKSQIDEVSAITEYKIAEAFLQKAMGIDFE
jgi:outer membrane protein